MLSGYSTRAISQRITIRYSLKELDLQSVEDYIRTHIKAAGSSSELFTSEAIKEIHCFMNKTKLVDDIVVKRIIKTELEN